MSQICLGIDIWLSLILHLPACLLAVVSVIVRRHPVQNHRMPELIFDCTKHVAGAMTGHGLLLAMAPAFRALTGWSTPCLWFVGMSSVDASLGLCLQLWIVVGPLSKIGRTYPSLQTGNYWNPQTKLKSPNYFCGQLLLWVSLSIALRMIAAVATLILVAPIVAVVACWEWLLQLSMPPRILLLAVCVPAISRSLQFLVIDPLIEGPNTVPDSSDEDNHPRDLTMWYPLNG